MSVPHGITTAAFMAAIAGYVNAVAYLGLHAFVAPMTGTVILVGFALADLHWLDAGRNALVICGFVGGVTAARLLRRLDRGPAPGWLISAALLASSAFRPLEGLLSLVPIAVALGCLNGSETRFGPATLNTTFITGNLERLGEAFADPSFPNRRAQLGLIAGILSGYAVGATAGVLGARHLGAPLAIPAAMLAMAGLLALLRRRVPA